MRNSYTIKHTLLASLLIIAFAQMNLSLFADGFKVAMGICCMAAAAYLVPTLSMPLMIILADLGVFASRVLAGLFQGSSLHEAMSYSCPEIVFYLTAGILIWALRGLTGRRLAPAAYACAVCFIDFLSNFIELSIRMDPSGLTSRILIVIAAVALIRGAALLIMLMIANEYRLTLLKRTNAEQYRSLMLLMARLQGEVAWMEKGSLNVEKIMTDAYSLYTKLDSSGAPRELVRSALDISKDIHEVKKEYSLIVRGIRDVIDAEPPGSGMDVKHLLMMVGDANTAASRGLPVRPDIRVECEDGIYTNSPYLILSVFNNLVTNAVEAFDGSPADPPPRPHITIRQRRDGSDFLFTVSDDGPGVSEDIAANIFEPGYSTKIDFDTGVVGRGLGLAIVHDIVTSSLKGSIRMDSGPDGTTFILRIPTSMFTEKKNDQNHAAG